MATGDFPGRLIYANRYIDDLIVFSYKKFSDYLKEIYPSQLTVEKANKSDHLADYLDFTFIIDSGGKSSNTQVTYGKGLQLICKNWFWGHICQILLHKGVKIGRITQLLVLNPVELIFLGNSHVIFRTHARKKLEINLKTASCST